MILCDGTLNISTGSSTAQENRLPLKAVGQTVFFFLKTERDKNSASNSFQTGRRWSVGSCFCIGSSLRAEQLELTNLLQDSAMPDYEPLPILLHTLLPHIILPMFWNFFMK